MSLIHFQYYFDSFLFDLNKNITFLKNKKFTSSKEDSLVNKFLRKTYVKCDSSKFFCNKELLDFKFNVYKDLNFKFSSFFVFNTFLFLLDKVFLFNILFVC